MISKNRPHDLLVAPINCLFTPVFCPHHKKVLKEFGCSALFPYICGGVSVYEGSMLRADAAERAALPIPQGQARDLRIFASKKDDKRYARSC